MSAIATYVAAMLRDLPECALPLAVLHERLCRAGFFTGGKATLLAALQRRPDLFTMVEPLQPFDGQSGWAFDERSSYDAALNALGRVGELRIALVEPAALEAPLLPPARSEFGTVLQPAEAALLALWSDAADDEALRADLSHALCELDGMRARLAGPALSRQQAPGRDRSTTHPRSPRARA